MKSATATTSKQANDLKQQNLKRSKQFKQFLRILNELNQNIYICVQDKKKGTIQHFSSDIAKFGNLHIAQATKDVTLQKIEQFNSQLAQMQDNKLNEADAASQGRSSCNSKKDTEASSHEFKSEFSKITQFECSDIELKNFKLDTVSSSANFEIFDNEKHIQMGKPCMHSLLNADLLSCADLPNEMSYQEMHQKSLNLFDINQVSNNSLLADAINVMPFEDGHDSRLFGQELNCQRRFNEDEVGLRINNTARRFFAHNALFRSASVIQDLDCEFSEDIERNDQTESEFALQQSYEGTMNPSNFSECESMPLQMQHCVSSVPMVIEELSDEDVSEQDNFYENDDETDMFFCCADWESQLTHEDEPAQMTPFNKRILKAEEKHHFTEQKLANEVFFDVDLVMKKQSTNSCGKLLGKRSKNNNENKKQVSPKKFAKVSPPSVSLFSEQSAKNGSKSDKTPSSQPFHDLCLSPMSQKGKVSTANKFLSK